MKTADLIEILVQDAATASPPMDINRRLGTALFLGGLVTLAAVVFGLHCQPLLAAARHGWFWMKAVYTGLLTIFGIIAVRRLAVPGTRLRAAPLLALAVVLLMFIAAATEIAIAPQLMRLHLWLGETWRVCSPLILLLSLPIYAGLIVALRTLAPTRSAWTGAAAGFTAGAGAATLYGLHCPEQSAAFVATWYTSGIAAAAILGALTGRKLLRW